jgi:hypothetical protein
MKVRGEYIFGYRCRITTKAATNIKAVNHVGTKADTIADRLLAEPLGYKDVSFPGLVRNDG